MSIRIGVLGCSAIAEKSVIPAIIKSEKFELVGVASRSLDKAADYAEKFNTLCYNYRQLLESDVEAVYVSLPVGLHYHWGKEVLLANKHLLMEKTFTQTSIQAAELLKLSNANRLACMEALMYQYHPIQKQIKELSSNIGEIRSIEAHFGFPHFDNKQDIRYIKELGGGAALDCLTYPLSFVFNLLGSNYKDCKSSIYYDKVTSIDERGYIHLQYPNTAVNISYGFGHSYRNEATIWGEKAIIKVHRVFTRPARCELPIEIWRNTSCTNEKTQPSNHFVDMLSEFSNNVKTLKNDSCSILTRVKFIEELLMSSGDTST